ncbi:MAG: hypothetical protein CMQ21_04865 [Gammaproteobacteria bacterium]|nr:hypothetical protein [Gammaproteobacteria bacterium]
MPCFNFQCVLTRIDVGCVVLLERDSAVFLYFLCLRVEDVSAGVAKVSVAIIHHKQNSVGLFSIVGPLVYLLPVGKFFLVNPQTH